MKKIIMIMIGLFLVLGFAGCNSDGSDIKIDMDEFMAAPTNLSITGDTLSWDEVDNAKGYIVYADGEEVDKVSDNSFDFDDLTGDKIIFQVQTRAPRGYQDSPLSATVAYVANREAEISSVENQVELMLPGADTEILEGIAEELVNKGFVGSDAEAMMTSYGEFMSLMSVVDDFDSLIDALDYLIDREADNIEALVSALIKEVLPIYLEDQIAYYEMRVQNSYSSESAELYQQQVDMYEDLLDEVEDNPEILVLAVVSTIEYFISVEEMINSNLVSLVDSLAETEDPEDLSASELNDVKEEIVNVLRETMPSEEDMVLLMEVFDLLASLSGASFDNNTEVENYKGKMAAQTLYSMEAFINFLDTFDEDYFEAIIVQMNSDEYYEVAQMEIIIETIIYFDTFKNDNEALLDTIYEVFTDEEKEVMFEEYMEAMENIQMDGYTPISVSATSINFPQLLNLQVIFEDSFDAVLDEFVETEGEFLRVLAIYNSFQSHYGYENRATGEVYEDWYEYYDAKNLASVDVMIEAVKLLNAFVQSLDEDAIDEMTTFLMDSVFETAYAAIEYAATAEVYELPFSETMIDAAKQVVALALEDANADILELVQNFFEYLVDEEALSDYKDLMLNQDDEDYEYMLIVFFANHYSSFMNNKNTGLVDDILEVLFDTLKDDELQAITGMLDADVTEAETMVDDFLTLLEDEFDSIKNIDPDNLSSQDKTEIEDFMESLQEIMFSF